MIINGIFLDGDEFVIEPTSDGPAVTRINPDDGSGEFVDGDTAAAVLRADEGPVPVRTPDVGLVAR